MPTRQFASATSKKSAWEETNFVPAFYTTQRSSPHSKVATDEFGFEFKIQLPSIDDHIDVDELRFLLKNGIKVPMQKINSHLRLLAEESEDLITVNRKALSATEGRKIAAISGKIMSIFYGMLECGIEPDVQSFYYVSRGLAKHQLQEEHEKIVDELMNRARDNTNFSRAPALLLHIFNNRIRMATKSGDWATTVDTLKLMKELRVQPNVMTMNTILFHLSQVLGDVDTVLLIYKIMKSDNIRPDARTYAITVPTLIKAGLHEEAWHLFTEMNTLRDIPDQVAINTLISADKNNAPADVLTKIFLTFKDRYKHNLPDYLYSAYIIALFKRNLYENILEEYNSLKLSNRRGTEVTLNFVINIASRRGDLDLILSCLADMPATGATSFTFSPILKGLRFGSLVIPDLKSLADLRTALQRLNAAATSEGQSLLVELEGNAASQARQSINKQHQ